jgi:outer membrane protein TolC
MKSRGGLSLALCALCFVCSTMPVSAGTLEELFTAATKSNQDYAVYKLDLEIANLKKTKGEIEAKVELDRVNAQYTYVSSLADYQSLVLSFYDKVIDAVFDTAIADLDDQSVALSLENAKEDKKYADVRYQNGLISEDDFKEIGIAYDTAVRDKQLSEYTLQDAKDYMRSVTGLEWNWNLIPEIPAFEPNTTLEDWVAKDITLEEATLTKKIQNLTTAALATNTSIYDRRIQEAENVRAEVAVTNAENNAKRSYESTLSTIKNDAALLQIRKDEYALKETLYQEAQRQFDNGTISLSSKNETAIDVLTAQQNLLTAQKNYIEAVASYLSAMGETPLGL